MELVKIEIHDVEVDVSGHLSFKVDAFTGVAGVGWVYKGSNEFAADEFVQNDLVDWLDIIYPDNMAP